MSMLIILVFFIVVIVIALAVTAAENRRYQSKTQPRICRSCALSHPPFASYCRRCGRRL